MDNFDDFERDIYNLYNVQVKVRNEKFGDWSWSIGNVQRRGFTSWVQARLNATEYCKVVGGK